MKYFFIIVLFLSNLLNSYAQSEICATDSLHHLAMQNIDYANEYREKNKKIEDYIEQFGNQRALCDNPIIIPVAVHFQGTTIGLACATEMVLDQLNRTNLDFSADNADINNWYELQPTVWPTIENKASCLQFCLATLNHPQGYGLAEGDYAITLNQTTGDFDSNWSGYLNIWVRDLDTMVAAGYSPLGGSGTGGGVTCRPEYFSTLSCDGSNVIFPDYLGRIITHEIGHYLNLSHPWATLNSTPSDCSSTDFVDDTPTTSAPTVIDCSNSSVVVTCFDPVLWPSYMDYTSNLCKFMFSAGQVDRMEAYVNTSLLNLVNNYSIKCLNPLCLNFAVAADFVNLSCAGNDGSISLNVTGGNNPITYSINNGTTEQGFPNFANLDTGFYQTVVTDAEGCYFQKMIVLKTDTPAVTIANVEDTYCGTNNGKVELEVATTENIQFSINNQQTWQDSGVFENLAPGTYEILAQIDNCLLNTPIEIKDLSNFSLQVISINPINCPLFDNGSISLKATGGKSPYSFILDQTTTSANGYFGELSEGVHDIFLTDERGCEERLEFETVKSFAMIGEDCPCTFFIPNALTANADGLNDLFDVVPNCPVADFELRIYDRWGTKVFESFDYKEKWNSALGNYYVQNGIYNYTITYRWGTEMNGNVEVQLEKGIIHVLR